MQYKKYIKVIAEFNESGRIIPQEIIWHDGRRFEIDRILDIAPRASLRAGGAGLRYTCSILGKERYLFLEENKWFVEG